MKERRQPSFGSVSTQAVSRRYILPAPRKGCLLSQFFFPKTRDALLVKIPAVLNLPQGSLASSPCDVPYLASLTWHKGSKSGKVPTNNNNNNKNICGSGLHGARCDYPHTLLLPGYDPRCRFGDSKTCLRARKYEVGKQSWWPKSKAKYFCQTPVAS